MSKIRRLLIGALIAFCLPLSLIISPTDTSANTPSTTPVLPQVTNVPLHPTPRATRTPASNLTQLPQARSVTLTPSPTPLPTLSAHPLLDQAVNAALSANSLRFSIVGFMETESARVQFTLRGTGANFDSLEQLQLHYTLTLTMQVDSETLTAEVEQKLIDGIVYSRARSGERELPWVAISFENMAIEIFDFEGILPFIEQGGEFLPPEGDPETLDEMFSIPTFERYVTLERFDVSPDEARFRLVIDIDRFLRSEEDLMLLLSLITRFTGTNLNLDAMGGLFELGAQYFIPDMELTIDRYVGITDARLTRIEINFDGATRFLSENPLTGDVVDFEFQAVISLVGYDEVYVIDVPPDAILVESLNDLIDIP